LAFCFSCALPIFVWIRRSERRLLLVTVTTGRGSPSGDVWTRLGRAELSWVGCSLRLRGWTAGSMATSVSAPAPASASASESESSICTGAGFCAEGGEGGVLEPSNKACAASTSCYQLSLASVATGSISRINQIAATREWATSTGWQLSDPRGITQPAHGRAVETGWSSSGACTWRNHSFA
jgi:hypothetical protein